MGIIIMQILILFYGLNSIPTYTDNDSAGRELFSHSIRWPDEEHSLNDTDFFRRSQ